MAALAALAAYAMLNIPFGTSIIYEPIDWNLLSMPSVLGGMFAVFWAAPLISREYENRTHVFAWTQDVSPARWLAGKAVVLAGVAALVSAVIGYVAYEIVHRPANDSLIRTHFHAISFDSHPLVTAAHTLFGFGLGLVASAFTRQTLVSMGLTFVAFVGVRGFTTEFLRPHYLPAIHEFSPRAPGDYVPIVPRGALRIDSGYADAAGNPMDGPQACKGLPGDIESCLGANGVAGHFADFQPAERVPVFQLIESGGYLLAAGVLFVIAFAWVRRGRRA
jgi:hypothetical protein